MKPRIKAHYRQPSTNLKWRCVSQESSYDGNAFERIGTGYSPQEAYQRWKRWGQNTTNQGSRWHYWRY